jgi:hypothetical protein
MQDMKSLAGEYQQKLQNDVRIRAEAELLKSMGPQAWADLRKLIKAKVMEFNTEMKSESLSWDSLESNQVSIRNATSGRKLLGGYDDAASTIHFKCPSAKIDLACVILMQGGEAVFQQTNTPNGIPVVLSKEEIASGLLRQFLLN